MNDNKQKMLLLGWIICSLGALFYCYEYLLRIEPSVMVPQLMSTFGVTATSLGMLVAIYYYIYTPMQIVVGIIIDIFGVRRIITLALICCTLGSLIFSTVYSIYIAALGRFLIGFGSAFAFVSVLKLAAVWLPKHRFALFSGLTTGLGMIGAMIGDIELTSLIHQIGWRQTLNMATLIGVILIPLVWFIVHDKPKHVKQLSDKTTTSFAIQQTFYGLLQIIKNPQMWFAGIIGGMFYLSLSVVAELWGIPFLQTVYQLNEHQAAIASSSIFAGWLIGAPLNGFISDLSRKRRLPLIVGGFLSAIMISVIIYHPYHFSYHWLLFLLFLFGVFSSVQIICFAVSRENNPTHITATSIAFANFLIMLGGLILQPLVGVLLDYGWQGLTKNGIRLYTASDYQHAFWVIPVLIFTGCFIALFLRESFCLAMAHDDFDPKSDSWNRSESE